MAETGKHGVIRHEDRNGKYDPQRFTLTDSGGRLEEAARRLWDLCEEYNKLQDMRIRDSASNHRMTCIIKEMWSYIENFFKNSHCPTVYDVVRNCNYELVNVFYGAEDEDQTMESVRDIMHMIVAEAEIQGLCRGIISYTSYSRTNDYVKLWLRHCVQLYAQQHHA